jgi:hypothetical protein
MVWGEGVGDLQDIGRASATSASVSSLVVNDVRKPASSQSTTLRHAAQLFACDSDNKCFRDLAARHRAFADVECADLRREGCCAIIANLLVTNRALGLLLKRKLEQELLVIRQNYETGER